jgi:predicted Rossmann fold flavoprotein
MTPQHPPILIIGGGGAGITSAWSAARMRAPATILERNPRIGIKILISGGGKCNITHSGNIDHVLDAFLPAERRFLKPAMYRFSNTDLLALLEDQGLQTEARPNGRVFPRTGNAKDVVRAFEQILRDASVSLRVDTRVESILEEHGRVTGVLAGGEVIPASHIIIATGGVSYPKTGTTGDGIRWASSLGHTIVPLRAALAPIKMSSAQFAAWSGVALRGGRLKVVQDGKTLTYRDDDILFTHEGISGPAALEVSRIAAEAMEHGSVALVFDFTRGREYGVVDTELNTAIQEQRNKTIATFVERWLPTRLVQPLLDSLGIDPHTRGHVLTRDQRRAVVRFLTGWTIGTIARVPLERGEVTAGGISLDEVEPRTMRSRILKGLYLCGEVLDIAGPVGGYNLQAAFSTGFVAGESAAEDWLRNSSEG